MNILLGVCGIGMGHSFRQATVIRDLIASGHRIMLFSALDGAHVLRRLFPTLPLRNVSVPWVHCGPHGIDFAQSADHPWNADAAHHPVNFRACADAVRFFGGPPDVIISDYEPICAQLAYAFDRPLITIDEQTKYLAFAFPSISGFHPNNEAHRLRLFFPRAYARITCSFFPIEYPPLSAYRAHLTAPPMRQEVLALQDATPTLRCHCLVYISPYASATFFTNQILPAIAPIRSQRFLVYSSNGTAATSVAPNVTFRRYSPSTFLRDLAGAVALIATAGHTLLSEAISLGVPTLAVPLPTYAQHACAAAIATMGRGVSLAHPTTEDIRTFLSTTKMRRADPHASTRRSTPHIYPSLLHRVRRCLKAISAGDDGSRGASR